MSLRMRQKFRLSSSFEDFASAKNRTIETKSAIKNGLKRPHNHIGYLHNYKWESNDCLLEVKGYIDGQIINYTELARKFNLTHKDGHTPDNAGQVVKEFLQANGCDLQRFKTVWGEANKDSERVRRKKRRYIHNPPISLYKSIHIVLFNHIKELYKLMKQKKYIHFFK